MVKPKQWVEVYVFHPLVHWQLQKAKTKKEINNAKRMELNIRL